MFKKRSTISITVIALLFLVVGLSGCATGERRNLVKSGTHDDTIKL